MLKTANVGNIDRVIRLVIGVVLLASPWFIQSQVWQNAFVFWLVPIVGAVLIATALFRFCPLYRLVGANTCKAK
ncbi:MAG: DUF2892 domain-containing protein [Hyphomicrobiales bacterium]|nr:DUF2892 domain-containing protein [Hyphomicrobiales bacterium]